MAPTVLTFDLSDGEIWFTTCRYDGSIEDGRDPFTGKSIKVPHNAPLTASEQDAVERVLESARFAGGPTNTVKVADGGTAEIDLAPSALMVKPRMVRPTVGLAGLLHELLLAGHWCIRGDEALLAANAEHAKHLPRRDPRVPDGFFEDFPEEVVVVESASALAAALGWTTRSR